MTNNLVKTGRVGNSQILLGRFSYGFENITVRQWGEGASLKIGAFCSIANSITVFLGGNHRADWITTFPFGHIFQDELGGDHIKGHPKTNGDVTIGNDVWVGSGVTIMSGVFIGDGAVLAANSTVVKDVEPYSVVGGNPAKTLKKRFDSEVVDLLLALEWWLLPLEDIKSLQTILCSSPDVGVLRELVVRYRG